MREFGGTIINLALVSDQIQIRLTKFKSKFLPEILIQFLPQETYNTGREIKLMTQVFSSGRKTANTRHLAVSLSYCYRFPLYCVQIANLYVHFLLSNQLK